jgi:hypothetical protein
MNRENFTSSSAATLSVAQTIGYGEGGQYVKGKVKLST